MITIHYDAEIFIAKKIKEWAGSEDGISISDLLRNDPGTFDTKKAELLRCFHDKLVEYAQWMEDNPDLFSGSKVFAREEPKSEVEEAKTRGKMLDTDTRSMSELSDALEKASIVQAHGPK